MEDQEILLNLIERSKQSRKSRRKWRPAKVTVKEIITRRPAVTEPLVKNYVTKPPSSLRKPKQKVKNIAAEIKKIRQKRRKVKSKPKPTKTRRKHSNMEMYWEKRLERAPKNILNDSLFREELKKTTPPPSRKGGGEQYKPTTSRPVQYKPRTKTPVFTRKRKTNSAGTERHYKRITTRANTTLGDRIRFLGTQAPPPAHQQADIDNTCKSKTVYVDIK